MNLKRPHSKRAGIEALGPFRLGQLDFDLDSVLRSPLPGRPAFGPFGLGSFVDLEVAGEVVSRLADQPVHFALAPFVEGA